MPSVRAKPRVEGTLAERIREIQDDSDLFDGRKELATSRALLERLIQKLEDSGFENMAVLGQIQKLLSTLISGQGRVVSALIAQNYYMSLSQAMTVMRQIGQIWHEEMFRLTETNPELRPLLLSIEESASRRFNEELALPAPPDAGADGDMD